MKSSEFITESKKRCPQCGMTNCTCAPGKCKCKPVAGWIPNKGFQKAAKQDVSEEWSQKYKSSINCSHPKGFSQRAHCAGKKKHNESVEMEMVCEDCGMCQTHGDHMMEVKQRLDAKCWTGKHKEGTKIKGGVRVNNCVPNESITEDLDPDRQFDMIEEMVMELAEAHGVDAEQIWEDFESVDDHELFETAAWRRSAGKSKKGGLNAKGVASYRRENPGSKLQMAVTTKPSKLKPGSKAAKRRKSFCARMSGVKGPMKKPNGKPHPQGLGIKKVELLMRATEFASPLDEIYNVPASEFRGGRNYLYDKTVGKTVGQLPGGSKLIYSIGTGDDRNQTIIKIWDPENPKFLSGEVEPEPVPRPREASWEFAQRMRVWKHRQKSTGAPGELIGMLTVGNTRMIPLPGAVQVDTITVDEAYRGRGIATALYGVVLTIMRVPLVAGSGQTPGGRKNWVSLSSIPGVNMKGYVAAMDDISAETEWSKDIDTVMGKLGGEYIGEDSYNRAVFSFDVVPDATGQQLEAYVNTNLSKIYSNSNRSGDIGLYATWSGQ